MGAYKRQTKEKVPNNDVDFVNVDASDLGDKNSTSIFYSENPPERGSTAEHRKMHLRMTAFK